MSQDRPNKPAQTQAERLRVTASTHQWVGAATIPLTMNQARTVDLRAALVIKADTRVQVLDAYCYACRQNWEACADRACPAVDPQSSEHLRGGRPGERRRRGQANPLPLPERPAPFPPPMAPVRRLVPAAARPVPRPAPRPAPRRPAPQPVVAARPVAVPTPPPAASPPAPARRGRRWVIPAGQLDLFALEQVAS